MQTPSSLPSSSEPTPSGDWFDVSQLYVRPAEPKADIGEPSPPNGLPPLKGPSPPAPVSVPPATGGRTATPHPAAKPADIPVPDWGDPSICGPGPTKSTGSARTVVDLPARNASKTKAANFRGRIGPYQVKDLIGEGGMGLVFKAEDVYLKRPVALKLMKPHISQDESAWKLFLNEAQATAALHSPRIATIYQVGEDDKTMYLAMELLKGQSLEARLHSGGLKLSEALWVVREAALGLSVAHEAGFFHRDIKPANLWLTASDDGMKSSDVMKRCHAEVTGDSPTQLILGVKLLDFGLVRMERDSKGQLRRGTVVGTPAYMAPEQAKGEMGDARSDLFSLGVVLFRLVTGELPFKGATPREILAALGSVTPPLLSTYNPNLPPSLVRLTERLLSRDPSLRPASAAEVAQSLMRIEEELANPRYDGAASSNRRLAMIVGTVMLTALSVAALWFALGNKRAADAVPGAAQSEPGVDGALAPHQVTIKVGERVTVEFTVASVDKGPGGVTYVYANDPQLKDEKFRLVLINGMLKALKDRNLFRTDNGLGQTLRASGVVTREGSIAEITIRETRQIERLAAHKDDAPTAGAQVDSQNPAKSPAKKDSKSPDSNTVVLPEDDFGQPLPNGLIPRASKTNQDDDQALPKALSDVAKMLKGMATDGRKR